MKTRELTLGGLPLSLHEVYKLVQKAGGYDAMFNQKGAWAKVFKNLKNYSKKETSASFRLKQVYLKYLYEFELSEAGIALSDVHNESVVVPPSKSSSRSSSKSSSNKSSSSMSPLQIARARAPSPALQQHQQQQAAEAAAAAAAAKQLPSSSSSSSSASVNGSLQKVTEDSLNLKLTGQKREREEEQEKNQDDPSVVPPPTKMLKQDVSNGNNESVGGGVQ